MIRIISCLVILIPVCFCIAFSPGLPNTKSKNLKNIHVFENSTKTWEATEALFYENETYLPMNFLEKYLGMVRKDLSDEQMGVCLDDLCIPFSKGKGNHAIKIYENQEYIPINQLFKALNGTCILDAEKDELLLNLKKSSVHSAKMSHSPVDFTLADIQGREVSLSDYRVEKVIVFAWASW